MNGSTMIVGAPLRRTTMNGPSRKGAAFLLDLGDRVELTHSITTGSDSDLIGAAVAIDGDAAIVGAPGRLKPGSPATRTGCVKFLSLDGGGVSESARICPPDTDLRNFGHAVAMAGDWAAAGAIRPSGDRSASGVVLLLRRDAHDGRSMVEALQSPTPSAYDRFGSVLAMRGDLLVVGSPGTGAAPPGTAGAMHIYRLAGDSWMLEQSIEAPFAEFCEGFGRAVAIGPDEVMVSAVEVDPGGDAVAAVFRYRASASSNASRSLVDLRIGLVAEDFGASLAHAGSMLVIGAPGATLGEDGSAHGAVLVIDPLMADLNGDGTIDGADLGVLLSQWGPCASCVADLNGDAVVDGADLGILLGAWS